MPREELTQAEYINEVETQADHLVAAARESVEEGEYDELEQAILDLSHHTLDGHSFFQGNAHGAKSHGAIIQFAEEESVDPVRYRDLTHLAESEDPPTIVEKVAYTVFEAHVIETAKEHVRGEL